MKTDPRRPTDDLTTELLRGTAETATAWLAGLAERPVRATATREELLAGLGGPLPEDGSPAEEVVAQLVRAAEPGVVGIPGPQYSRRARGFAAWAALRQLGRAGVASLIERQAALAARMGAALRAAAADGVGVEVLNDVVFNQVLVRFPAASGDRATSDARTHAVVAGVQDDGACWLAGSTWHGMAVMRVSVSNWSTTEADIDRSAAAIVRVARAIR